jgi:hypothetical protein
MKNRPIPGYTPTLLLLVILAVSLAACGKLWNRERDCNAFKLSNEVFWFPKPIGSQYVFKNASGDSVLFTKADNYIWHTTGYTTDTGCGCNDQSGQLLTAGNDSIWFNTEMRYIEDNLPQRIETIGVVLNGRKAIFTEADRTSQDTLYVHEDMLYNTRKYARAAAGDALTPVTIFLAENNGLVRIVFQNGQMMELASPPNLFVTVNDFLYGEGWCD